MPECATNASSGRCSVMYDSTSIEANAVYVSSSGYCYDGSEEDLTRMCEMTAAWTGDEPDPEDFIEGTKVHVHVHCTYMCMSIHVYIQLHIHM